MNYKMALKDCWRTYKCWPIEFWVKTIQLCTTQATYFGYHLMEDKWSLSQSGIVAILQSLTPKTKRQVQEFLGACRYCCFCIVEFVEVARPPYTSTKSGQWVLVLTETKQEAFEALHTPLTLGPVLALSDISNLLIHLAIKKSTKLV